MVRAKLFRRSYNVAIAFSGMNLSLVKCEFCGQVITNATIWFRVRLGNCVRSNDLHRLCLRDNIWHKRRAISRANVEKY